MQNHEKHKLYVGTLNLKEFKTRGFAWLLLQLQRCMQMQMNKQPAFVLVFIFTVLIRFAEVLQYNDR